MYSQAVLTSLLVRPPKSILGHLRVLVLKSLRTTRQDLYKMDNELFTHFQNQSARPLYPTFVPKLAQGYYEFYLPEDTGLL